MAGEIVVEKRFGQIELATASDFELQERHRVHLQQRNTLGDFETAGVCGDERRFHPVQRDPQSVAGEESLCAGCPRLVPE